LYLKCSDTYEGLSEKMMCAINFILTSKYFENITHILKVDDHDTDFDLQTIKEISLKHKNILNSENYVGQNYVPINLLGRQHHFGKVSTNSIWFNKEYNGPVVPYLGGGETYILSKKALICLNENKNMHYQFGSYEDVMMGFILNKYNIFPYKLDLNIKTWRG